MFGNLTLHSRVCMPPIDPPITANILFMPRCSIKYFWALTISPIVTIGNCSEYGRFVFGFMDPGPVDPIQPPRTLGQMTKYLLVSIPLPGPIIVSHQPDFSSSSV